MKYKSRVIPLVASVVFSMLSHAVIADDKKDNDKGSSVYAIKVTNMTRGQIFTPILAVTHKRGIRVFNPGTAASDELEQLAEGGDVDPLKNAMLDSGRAFDSATSDPLPPGQSVTLLVKTKGNYNYISLASMLIPTNDAFFALNGIKGPGKGQVRVITSPAYDAGTESNNEVCAYIPGPDCGGEGYVAGGGEGYVHIHAGMHGIGDLPASDRDWRNPVARIYIERVK